MIWISCSEGAFLRLAQVKVEELQKQLKFMSHYIIIINNALGGDDNKPRAN